MELEKTLERLNEVHKENGIEPYEKQSVFVYCIENSGVLLEGYFLDEEKAMERLHFVHSNFKKMFPKTEYVSDLVLKMENGFSYFFHYTNRYDHGLMTYKMGIIMIEIPFDSVLKTCRSLYEEYLDKIENDFVICGGIK